MRRPYPVVSWLTARLAAALLGLVLGLFTLSGPALAATITVTNANDTMAGGDGCSLREALQNANNNNASGSAECTTGSGADTIRFNLQNGVNGVVGSGPYTVTLTSGLTVSDGTTIDGYAPSQAGASANTRTVSQGSNASIMIEISGGGTVAICLTTNGPGVTVRGLAINRCTLVNVIINASGTTFSGNVVGTDPDGSSAYSGTGFDMQVNQTDAIIGGPNPADRNVFSGVTGRTIVLAPGAHRATIQGNFIGVNSDGTGRLSSSSGGQGIDVNDATDAQIGGTVPEERNVVAGVQTGIIIERASANAVVQGNYVGTTADGTGALGNGYGIYINELSGTPAPIIGGTVPGAGNLIVGSTLAGIFVDNGTPQGTTIQGNTIGGSGTGFANAVGITAANGAGGLTIGGVAAGAGNTIAFNTGAGVLIPSDSTGNSIRGNAIHANGGLGIDLAPAGVTENDLGDGDTDANNLQNFPVVTSASTVGGTTRVVGTLNSAAGTTFDVDIYSSTACDDSGNGEGQTYRGSTTVNTLGGGSGSFIATLGVALPIGTQITVTATSPGGDTSEFSDCRAVAVPTTGVTESGGGTATVEGGASDTFDVVLTEQPTADVTVTLSSSAPGIVAFSPSATLTFTTADWNVPRTVTVASVEDQTVRGPNHTIGYTATSADARYDGLAGPLVNAAHTDNDTASIVVAPRSVLTTTESGGTAQFTVRLTSIPTGPVQIGLISTNTAEGTVSPNALTFAADATALNDRPVTVTGVDDGVLDGPVAYAIVTAAASSGDPFYNGLDPADVSVTNQDDEVATSTPTETATATPTVTATTTPTATATATMMPTASPTVTATWSPTPTPVATATPVPVRPSEDDDDKPARLTREQRQQAEHTNAGNRDDVHTEGQVIGVERSADGGSLLVTIALGPGGRESLVVEVLCDSGGAAACPDVLVGDYLVADGYQQGVGDPTSYFVAADDVDIVRDGRRIR